ncbi:sensor domain-containing diguanylate cyclase [Massilia sp. S19_KUP03_FR1]|uniref:sensor domain-containing diguanylate cyclase n=1 Tax=Massilia sp. S19_KUP03_FR1 TaxID=3025503 RepID=UPI002FCD85FB
MFNRLQQRLKSPFRLGTLITIGVCLTVGLTVLIQVALVHSLTMGYAGKDAELRLQQLSWQMRDSLNRVVAKGIGDVRLLAELPEVRQADNPAKVRAVLESLQATFPDYAWIGIAHVDGKVFASTLSMLQHADVSARPWFQSGKLGVHAEDYHPAVMLGKLLPVSPDQWRFIDMSGPVLDEAGKLRGVLGLHLSWNWVRQRAEELVAPALREYGAEIFVVRGDGTVLLGPPGSVETRLATRSMELARGGQTGSVRETWANGVSYLTGYSTTGTVADPATLRWTVLVRQAEDVAMAGPRHLEQRVLQLSLVLAAGFAMLAAWLARRLTGPMDALTSTIEQAARSRDLGDGRPVIPEITAFHEAQVLSQSMRELVRSEHAHLHALKTLNDQLEGTVAQRTAELQALLMRDALTNLPNRRAIMQILPEALDRAARSGRPCAVLFLDLDGFKAINDTHGHEEGDALLRQFGARVQQAVRKTDTVARLAGDEFVVVLELLSDAADANDKARQLIAMLQAPYQLTRVTVTVSASIGVALHQSDDVRDLTALLARADAAMYAAKREGKNRVVTAPPAEA